MIRKRYQQSVCFNHLLDMYSSPEHDAEAQCFYAQNTEPLFCLEAFNSSNLELHNRVPSPLAAHVVFALQQDISNSSACLQLHSNVLRPAHKIRGILAVCPSSEHMEWHITYLGLVSEVKTYSRDSHHVDETEPSGAWCPAEVLMPLHIHVCALSVHPAFYVPFSFASIRIFELEHRWQGVGEEPWKRKCDVLAYRTSAGSMWMPVIWSACRLAVLVSCAKGILLACAILAIDGRMIVGLRRRQLMWWC